MKNKTPHPRGRSGANSSVDSYSLMSDTYALLIKRTQTLRLVTKLLTCRFVRAVRYVKTGLVTWRTTATRNRNRHTMIV